MRLAPRGNGYDRVGAAAMGVATGCGVIVGIPTHEPIPRLPDLVRQVALA